MLKRQWVLFFLFVIVSSKVNALSPEIIATSDNEFNFQTRGSKIYIELDHSLLDKKEILLDWILNSAEVIIGYYGQFPVKQVHIELESIGGEKVTNGQAFGGDFPYIRVVVGKDTNPEILRRDWILVHEMVHLAMANIARNHRWLLEGLATYVESIARAQKGQLSDEFVWSGFIKRMPQGLPRRGDEGLDYTPTWGRTYWGGAIFCLLADIEIRKQTDNRYSLQDALKGVLKKGYSMQSNTTTPSQIFKAGDEAVGISVLLPLYEKMKGDPYPIDMAALWKSLGISIEGNKITYNNDAPLAHIRKRLLVSHRANTIENAMSDLTHN